MAVERITIEEDEIVYTGPNSDGNMVEIKKGQFKPVGEPQDGWQMGEIPTMPKRRYYKPVPAETSPKS